MAIPQQIIDDIKSRTDIEEVVGDFVTLKRKGQNLWALCPFHNEKTPSFSVAPAKGIYKCFGCGKAGDAINFIEEVEGLSYVEALKYLAQKYGIEIKEEFTSGDQKEHNERESLYLALNFASEQYRNNLFESEEGRSIGLSYFRERGFSDDIIKKFELGYALDKWEGLTETALKSGYSEEVLLNSGLTVSKEGGKRYDRFRGRVIFPIHNLTGKTIAFGARTLRNDKKQPKYLNSPETAVYNKSRVLYGLNHAKTPVRQSNNCIIVEGYTDVISLHQAGVENVVSSSGTSLTADQVRLIGRYTENVTVLFDGDSAGQAASSRGVDIILEAGLDVKVAVLPEGEDPDSYVKSIGKNKFISFLEETATDFIKYKAQQAVKDVRKDPVKKVGVIREIIESISKVSDGIKRAVYFRECSNLLDIDESVLITEYNKLHLKERRKKREDDKEPEINQAPDFPDEVQGTKDFTSKALEHDEKEILRLLVRYGNELVEEENIGQFIINELEDVEFYTPLHIRLLDMIRSGLAEEGKIEVESFISHHDHDIKKLVIDLISDKYSLSKNWEKHEIYVPSEQESLAELVPAEIIRYKQRVVQKKIKDNREKLKEAVENNNQEEVITLMQMFMQLKEAEKQLARELGNVIAR